MVKIECEVEINRPIEEVFAFLADHENDTKWRSGLVEWKRTSEGTGVGSTSTAVLQFMGHRVEISMEVTEYVENIRIGFKTTSGPMPMEGLYSLEPAEGGTKLALAVQGEASGLFKLAEPLFAGIVKSQIETDFKTLKDLLEAGG